MIIWKLTYSFLGVRCKTWCYFSFQTVARTIFSPFHFRFVPSHYKLVALNQHDATHSTAWTRSQKNKHEIKKTLVSPAVKSISETIENSRKIVRNHYRQAKALRRRFVILGRATIKSALNLERFVGKSLITMKFQRMKFIYIGIFIIPFLTCITASPVYSWLKSKMDSHREVTINGEKPKPTIPPWAKANGRGN